MFYKGAIRRFDVLSDAKSRLGVLVVMSNGINYISFEDSKRCKLGTATICGRSKGSLELVIRAKISGTKVGQPSINGWDPANNLVIDGLLASGGFRHTWSLPPWKRLQQYQED